jgi:proteasome lid subunit RPN8/RPN11
MTEIKIHRKVKAEIEKFLRSSYGNEYEWGGYLLERSNGVINKVIFVPNVSNTPRTSYVFPALASVFADKIKRSSRLYLTIAAEWHSHPDPCVMSTGDTCYSRNHNTIEVMITPLGSGWHTDYEWYACKGIEPVRIKFV